MNDSTQDNRRNFHRVFFEAPVTLSCEEHSIESQLVDISLNGALIRLVDQWTPQIGKQVDIDIDLDDEETHIRMQCSISHINGNLVGLKREHIDMDSITHLRRLVELNLGDSELLHRELEHLAEPQL
ncbi:MAG: PilZ domain-containing protein [Chromatiales bacterium]|jgi:hypothetical protein